MADSEFDHKAAAWDQEHARVERARSIAAQLCELIPVTADFVCLDFGCGTGLLGFNLIPRVKHLAFADTSAGMLAEVSKKLAAEGRKNGRVMLLDDKGVDGDFDLIMSLMALHHIDDYLAAIAGLCAALKPGGWLCLCDLETEDGSFHAPEVVPHNGFDPGLVAAIMEGEGLTVTCTKTVHANQKVVGGETLEFPVFMVVGHRE